MHWAQENRPVLIAWLVFGCVCTAPYLAAWLWPPAGTAFAGFFFFVDDSHNYLSYAEQASRGSLLLLNKDSAGAGRAIVNVEWWVVGWLQALLGGRPALAYRLFGLAATLAMMLAADRWLQRADLPRSHRLPALFLVFGGAGLGGVCLRLGWLPGSRCVDLVTGLFPSIEVLSNPHFVAGTTLLLLTLGAFAAGRPVRGVALGTLLGLVRPYEVLMVAAARAAAVVSLHPARAWVREVVPLACLLPVVAYNAFVVGPAFGVDNSRYSVPALLDFLPALGPAVLLAGLGAVRNTALSAAARAARIHLVAWALVGVLAILLRPVTIVMQFVVGLGLPLLALAALALARFAPRATWLAAAAMATTPLVALGLIAGGSPRWFVSAERLAIATAARAFCAPHDRLLAPPDVSLFAAGRSACGVVVAHAASVGFEERAAAVRRFYGSQADPAWRRGLIDRFGVTRVIWPGAAPDSTPWLGDERPLRRLHSVGTGDAQVSIYGR